LLFELLAFDPLEPLSEAAAASEDLDDFGLEPREALFIVDDPEALSALKSRSAVL